jgi:hypothetical protein
MEIMIKSLSSTSVFMSGQTLTDLDLFCAYVVTELKQKKKFRGLRITMPRVSRLSRVSHATLTESLK